MAATSPRNRNTKTRSASRSNDGVDAALRRAERSGAAKGLKSLRDRRRAAQRLLVFDLWSTRGLVFLTVLYGLGAYALGWRPALVFVACWAALILIGRAILTSREKVIASVSLIVYGAIYFTAVAPHSSGIDASVTIGLGVTLPLAAAFAPFALPRGPFDRGITALIGHAGLLATLLVALWSPRTGITLGLLWVLGTCIARAGGLIYLRAARARFRSGVPTLRRHETLTAAAARAEEEFALTHNSRNIDKGIAAEIQNAARMLDLGPEWTVLHSRRIPGLYGEAGGNADVDHILIGPQGIFIVDSKNHHGRIHLGTNRTPSSNGEGDFEWESLQLDGSLTDLLKTVNPSVYEASAVAEILGVNPDDIHVVLAFTDRMSLPGPLSLLDVPDEHGKSTRTVEIIPADRIVEHVTSGPLMMWRGRGRLGKRIDAWRGRDPRQADLEANTQFLRDLGLYANYALPPKG